jgi:hypothetical protein
MEKFLSQRSKEETDPSSWLSEETPSVNAGLSM